MTTKKCEILFIFHANFTSFVCVLFIWHVRSNEMVGIAHTFLSPFLSLYENKPEIHAANRAQRTLLNWWQDKIVRRISSTICVWEMDLIVYDSRMKVFNISLWLVVRMITTYPPHNFCACLFIFFLFHFVFVRSISHIWFQGKLTRTVSFTFWRVRLCINLKMNPYGKSAMKTRGKFLKNLHNQNKQHTRAHHLGWSVKLVT